MKLKLPKLRPDQVRSLIFTTVRIAGPIVTAGLGIHAGKKIQQAEIEMLYTDNPDDPNVQENGLYFEELSRGDQFKVIAPKLIPPIVSAGVTIAAAVIDKHTDAKRIAEMTGLYSTAMLSASVYKKKLEEKDPKAVEDAEKEIGEKEQLIFKNNPKALVERAKNVPNADTVFIDTLTGREFLSTVDAVQKAIQNTLIRYKDSERVESLIAAHVVDADARSTRYLGLNEFYRDLGIRETYFGDEFGYVSFYDHESHEWNMSGDSIDIHLVESNEDNTYLLAYGQKPVEGWYAL